MKKCAKCGEEKELGEFALQGRLDRYGNQSRRTDCKQCHCEYVKNKYPEKKKSICEYQKKRYDANPEVGKEKTRKWREENVEKMKEHYGKWHMNQDRFKVALQSSRRAARNGGYLPCSATVEEIKAAFTGKCDVCGVPEFELTKKLCLDHNHFGSGELRGWLCRKCNTALGMLGDSEELLINMLHYIMNPIQLE